MLTYHVVDGAFDSETVVGLGDRDMVTLLGIGQSTIDQSDFIFA